MAPTDRGLSVWHKAVVSLFRLPPRAALYVCAVLFVALAAADLLTPPQLNLSIFYVFVILLAVWNVGPGAGVCFAVAAGVVQWLELSQISTPYLHSIYWYFWLANRWLTFLLVIVLTDPVRALFERHRAAARIDPLTGAANQKHFHELVSVEAARSTRTQEPFAVVFMDCDDFKLVNDQFGHASGDTLLRRIVETARESTRASDTVARLGGH